MKFCTKCGAEVEDSVLICPKCGNSLNSKNKTYSSPVSPATPAPANTNSVNVVSSSESTKAVLMVFTILSSLVFAVGLILLIIGGVQELKFRSEYDLSKLTEAGINLARKYSNYSNSITFLTTGGILAGVGLVIDLILIPYRTMIAKRK